MVYFWLNDNKYTIMTCMFVCFTVLGEAANYKQDLIDLMQAGLLG